MFLFPTSGSGLLFHLFPGLLWRVCFVVLVHVANVHGDGKQNRQINQLIEHKVFVSLINAVILYF